MFVDTAQAEVRAGKGGDGAVSFRHEIYLPKGGPDGGDGGTGGSVIFKADHNLNTLLKFRFQPLLIADNGQPGSGSRSTGKSGADLIVKVPVGTMVYRLDTELKTLLADLTDPGQTAVIARGGAGGWGNFHFKSSVRQAPRFARAGKNGEAFKIGLELRLLADVGLVGLPNAGKSTFLSVVSNAAPKIADYPFTTLTPQLGVAVIDGRNLLIADIPGLIAGAGEGKGLGHAFLRHVARTAVLLYLIDVYSDDAGAVYQTLQEELSVYAKKLRAEQNAKTVISTTTDLDTLAQNRSEIPAPDQKPKLVALTKCEGVDPEIIALQTAAILKIDPEAKVYAISATAHQGIDELLRDLKTLVQSARAAKDAAD